MVKWILKKKTRTKWAISLLAFMVLLFVMNKVFFTKMEFIQSKIYPNLYLIKNPISDKDSIQKVIQKIVIEKINHHKKYIKDSIISSQYTINFYKYNTGWDAESFGASGTAHFLEQEEDAGGFSSEVLNNYQIFRIAQFNVKYCTLDTINYYGTIDFYEEYDKIKTDTLFNKCKPIFKEIDAESASDYY